MEILPTHTREHFAEAVRRAAALLTAGELVALPTETVYGLAANALNPQSVERLFMIKGRPRHNPIIVHVDSLAMARRCANPWPVLAESLAAAFWPGPLTLVVPRSPEIPDVVTAGGPTVGVRWPSHPLIQAVIGACGFPLAAPSANVSNHLSPTTAEHVRACLEGKVALVVDGGPSQIGIESTVVDVSLASAPPRLLRPGMIHEDLLLAVTGEFIVGYGEGASDARALRSPGLLPRHYAPRAKLVVRSWRNEADLRGLLAPLGAAPEATHILAHSCIPVDPCWGRVSVIPHDAEAYARALYAELHVCDAAAARLIIVEAPPDSPEWRGIADRLARAEATGAEAAGGLID